MAAAAAQAQSVNGLYVTLGGGVNIMQKESARLDGFPGVDLDLQTKAGAVGLTSIGWGYGNGLRAEVELGYRYNGYDRLSGPGGSVSLSGSEQKFGPMVNVFYDFNGFALPVTPYVGLGVGYQWAREQLNLAGGSGWQTKGAFAYQAIVGAALPLAAVPGLALTAEYRFLGMSTDRKYDGVRLGNDFNHSVLVGVRYAFGARAAASPAPAAPIAAVPAPASRSYLVFFDWDKATLTDRARQIVAEAAANAAKVQYTRIEVSGYTDTSGTPKYNHSLSIRRAQVVAAELVKDGVPKDAIAVQGFGDTHLLVPTGPGVREPQNRRVEIVIK
ncbi:MAG TPA: OmpA family protein [Rhodopila sp.]|nr:OmpA family protein [Rhodopila sp.]